MHADSNAYGTEKISRLLLKVAPPVMLAQLIQALYNLVDSLFVGEYSAEGLTALSIIYPIQLLMIAFAVVNIILDPILIFGLFGMKPLGIAGAAIATVIGQIIAAVIVMKKGIRKSPSLDKYLPGIKRIYKLGFPNIVMQMAFTLYIFRLNLILVQFSDQAVTTLGLYATCYFNDISGIFSGNRLCIQKFSSYNRKNSRFICAAWLYICKVWAEFFLVHISGN